MICDIRFNNSTSETRHSDKCNLNHTDEPLLSFTFCEKRVNGFLFDAQGGDRCIDGHFSSYDNEISARQKCSPIYIFSVMRRYRTNVSYSVTESLSQ